MPSSQGERSWRSSMSSFPGPTAARAPLVLLPASEPRGWLVRPFRCLVRRPQRVQARGHCVDDAVEDRQINDLLLVARRLLPRDNGRGLPPGLRLWAAGRCVGAGSTGDQQYGCEPERGGEGDPAQQDASG
jgi:hypothetical protein